MYPFITLNDLTLPTYATIILIGLIFGFLIAIFRSSSYRIKKIHILISTLFIMIGMFIGAKLLYAIVQIPSLVKNFDMVTQYPQQTIIYALSGFVFYGGLIGALLGLILFSFQFDQPLRTLINIYIPIIPFVHFIGRIGCLFAGCCYGIEYHGLFHLDYPEFAYIQGVNLVSRFPVQIMESFLNLLLFIALFIYTRKPRNDIKVLGIYLISYGIIRFICEFFRGDIVRGVIWGLSTAQWLSLMMIPIAIYLLKKK